MAKKARIATEMHSLTLPLPQAGSKSSIERITILTTELGADLALEGQ